MRAIVVAIAIGVTAPMSVSLIGLTMNDWYTAAFVLRGRLDRGRGRRSAGRTAAHVVRGGTPGRRRRGPQADRFDLRRRAGRGGARRARQPARASAGCGGDGHGRRAGVRAHRRAVDADDARALRQSAVSLLQRRVPLAVGRPGVVFRDALRSGLGGRVAGVPVHAAVEARSATCPNPSSATRVPALLYALALAAIVVAVVRRLRAAPRRPRHCPVRRRHGASSACSSSRRSSRGRCCTGSSVISCRSSCWRAR